MKVGGGLNYVTGPMGAGKTLYGVRRIVENLIAGRYAITNVELREGWELRVARRISRLASPAKHQRIAERLAAHYIYEPELELAMRYRLPGDGEARGLLVWDEGQHELNNRDWRREGRDDILRWATQLRKLGYVGYLLSQHADNTDVALRRVCSFAIRLQNQREQTRMLGVRVTPWPLFLAFWFPAHIGHTGGRAQCVKLERYFLDWHRHLYDSWGLFHGLTDVGQGTILLPEGGRRVPLAHRPPAGAIPLRGQLVAVGDAASPSESGVNDFEWSEAPDHADSS